MSHFPANDAELRALRLPAAQPAKSRHDLSRDLGLSLGKPRYVLRTLLDNCPLETPTFERSDRKLAYAYLLTPSGLKEILRLSRNFPSRTEKKVAALQASIAMPQKDVQDLDVPAQSS